MKVGDVMFVFSGVHGNLDRLSCSDCGKMFTSKRSLFGHKKEKHSGQLGMDVTWLLGRGGGDLG